MLADEPIGYWRLGETFGSTAADETGTNPGVYENGPTMGLPGAIDGDTDGALGFDGVDDDVRIPASPSLDVGHQVTFEAWTKYAAGDGVGPILEYSLNGGMGMHFWRFSDEDSLWVNFVSMGGAAYSGMAGATLTPDVWHHVVLTYDGNTVAMYVDAVQVLTAVTGPMDPDTRGDLYIGERPISGYHMKGELDEVAVYPYALSQQQIQTHYDVGR